MLWALLLNFCENEITKLILVFNNFLIAATPSTFETPESRIAATPGGRPDTQRASEVAEEEAPTHNPEPPESMSESLCLSDLLNCSYLT